MSLVQFIDKLKRIACTFLWVTGLQKPINTQYWSLLDSGQ